MLLVPVNSSDIFAWGWQSYLPAPVAMVENLAETVTGGEVGGALGELQIQFTNGRIYSYANVLDSEFAALNESPSKGSAFWAYIRRNPMAHPFTRLA
jgi:hypothetical protein